MYEGLMSKGKNKNPGLELGWDMKTINVKGIDTKQFFPQVFENHLAERVLVKTYPISFSPLNREKLQNSAFFTSYFKKKGFENVSWLCRPKIVEGSSVG